MLASITTTLTDWVAQHGAYAIFAIMAIDAVLPAGGELTMLFAGALAAGAIAGHQPVLFGHTLNIGLESYVVLALAGTLGYLVGSLIGWAIGRWGGREFVERHGRWVHLSPQNFARADRWFEKHDTGAVFLGRLTPLVRSFVSIPAGVFEMPLAPYTAWTALSSAIWCFGFAAAGWALGKNYNTVHHAFTGIEVALVAGGVAAVAWWLVRRRRSARAQNR